jgi:DNA mismatch endonuclease, patch repair protein
MPRPPASTPAVRGRMQRQARRDTEPELLLRREAHRLGLRYRVDRAPLPGIRRRADLVFPRARIAVFVDGCFWHCCPVHRTMPKANAGWWAEKLAANVRRDRDTDARLGEAGWTVIRYWEHEDMAQAARALLGEVRRVRSDRRGRPASAAPPSP